MKRSDQRDALDSNEDGAQESKGEQPALTPFACPFYKSNPTRVAYIRSCSGLKFFRIRDIKQHLLRSHRQPPQCTRCRMTFSDKRNLMAHHRASTPCVTSLETSAIEGIDEAQEYLLRSGKPFRGFPKEDQWETIYQILFPEIEKCDIPSPYYEDIETQLSARSRDYEEYLRQQLPSVLSEHLRRSGVHSMEDKLKELIQTSLENMVQGFPHDHQPPVTPPSAYPRYANTPVPSRDPRDPGPQRSCTPNPYDHRGAYPPPPQDMREVQLGEQQQQQRQSILHQQLRPPQAVLPTVAGDAPLYSNDLAPIPSDDASYHRELNSAEIYLDPSSTNRSILTSEENVHGTEASTAVKQELYGSNLDKNDDIPYTDSGYASARGPVYPSMHEKNTEDADHAKCVHTDATSGMDANDANTSYSAVTAILPELAENCVVDVCNNISSRLDGKVDRSTLVSLSKRLPELIKAFAVKLGSDMPDQMNLRVMHFVHKHHQHIVSQLRNEFHCNVNEPASPQRQMETMPLDEIMNMWGKNDNERPVAVEPSEYFEGVEDEDVEDQKEDISSLSEYSWRIVNSAAYEWLISSLVKEATFRRDDAQQYIMMDQIRQEILSQLPTGRISSKRLPTQHTVSFKVPKSSVPFLPEDAVLPSSSHSQTTIADRIVATSSSDDNIQLLKVSEYMDQTWPLGGGTLLSVLQSVINGAGQARAYSTLEGNGEIEIIFNGAYLEVFVTGTSYFIAESGEQLAWLTAALQPAISTLATYVRPFMRHVDNYTTLTEKRHSWVIELVKEKVDDTDSTACFVQEWQSDTKNPDIVQGFPTLSRPGNCPGIELPWQLPISLAPSLICMGKATRFLLTATGKVLHLFAQTQGVTIWHILSSPREDCTCHQRFLKTDDKGPLSSPDVVHIWQGRHIISACSTAELYYRGQEPGVELKNESAEVQRRKDSLSGATRPSPCTSSTADCSDSLDEDMLSIPDVSEDSVVEFHDSDDATSSVIAVVAARLISEYKRYTKCSLLIECASNTKQCSPGQQQPCSTQGSIQSTLGEGTTPASSIKSIQKRRMGQDDRNGDEDDSRRQPKRQRLKDDNLIKGLQIFACPFWKQNPGKHRDCFGKRLSMICRVKQHLARTHMLGIYCDRCLAVFPDLGHKRAHLRNEQCKFDDSRKLDGITSDQRTELSRKSNPLFTEPEKWFAVWDIVFPDLSRPSSPYLDLELSQELSDFREFTDRRGLTVLREALGEEGVVLRNEDDVLFLRAVKRATNLLFDEWLLNRAQSSQNSTSEGSSPAETRNRQQHDGRRRPRTAVLTDRGSNTDSGVELGSQPSSGPSRQDANFPPHVPIQPRPPLGSRPNMEPPGTANLGVQAARMPRVGADFAQVFVEPSSSNMAQFDDLYENRENESVAEPLEFDTGEEWPRSFDEFDANAFFASFDNSHLGRS